MIPDTERCISILFVNHIVWPVAIAVSWTERELQAQMRVQTCPGWVIRYACPERERIIPPVTSEIEPYQETSASPAFSP